MYRDLAVCIRCHDYPDFVLDTVDSIRTFMDGRSIYLLAAVDGRNDRLGGILEGTLGQEAVYVARCRYGWGAGLYGLLATSLRYFGERFHFGHFLSLDYDTLIVKPGADTRLLGLIRSPSVGLIGHWGINQHWAAAYHREEAQLTARLGGKVRTYRPGEGVQGGAFLLTRSAIEAFRRHGLLDGCWLNPAAFTTIADDHLIPLLVRSVGLEILPVPDGEFHLRWKSETDPIQFAKRPVRLFHPTKVRPGLGDRGVELRVRNFYRRARGREPLK